MTSEQEDTSWPWWVLLPLVALFGCVIAVLVDALRLWFATRF